MRDTTIHVAYAIGRGGGTHYRARAYVLEYFAGAPVRHSFSIAIDDSAKEAESRAVEYIREEYRREGLTPPESVVHHGRQPGALVDDLLFPIPATMRGQA